MTWLRLATVICAGAAYVCSEIFPESKDSLRLIALFLTGWALPQPGDMPLSFGPQKAKP